MLIAKAISYMQGVCGLLLVVLVSGDDKLNLWLSIISSNKNWKQTDLVQTGVTCLYCLVCFH